MLWPLLMPLCLPAASQPSSIGPWLTALLAIGIHTLAMLTVTTAVAVAVYEWIGLEILRRAWFNIDLISTLPLLLSGGLLLLVWVTGARLPPRPRPAQGRQGHAPLSP